jgi:hypothetical protein
LLTQYIYGFHVIITTTIISLKCILIFLVTATQWVFCQTRTSGFKVKAIRISNLGEGDRRKPRNKNWTHRHSYQILPQWEPNMSLLTVNFLGFTTLWCLQRTWVQRVITRPYYHNWSRETDAGRNSSGLFKGHILAFVWMNQENVRETCIGTCTVVYKDMEPSNK